MDGEHAGVRHEVDDDAGQQQGAGSDDQSGTGQAVDEGDGGERAGEGSYKYDRRAKPAGTPAESDGETVEISDNHYIATLMRCLSDSLIASHREPQPTYSFSFGEEDLPMEEEDSSDADFENVAIAQIERHRRIDEWDSSYQNVYSITALECLQKLTKAGISKLKPLFYFTHLSVKV